MNQRRCLNRLWLSGDYRVQTSYDAFHVPRCLNTRSQNVGTRLSRKVGGRPYFGKLENGKSKVEYLDKQSSVMSGPRKNRSRGSWSHIVSKATDA